MADRLLNYKLQKDNDVKHKIEEERKKMFKPTIDTNSCKLAAKTEGVFEKALVKQKVDQTHMVDYFRAEEVFDDKKSAKLKSSNGKQSPPRLKAPKDKQTRLPGTKQEFDNVRSKYMDALLTPKKKPLDSPASRVPELQSSGKRALQSKQPAAAKKPAAKPKDSPAQTGDKKVQTGERASKRSRSSGRGYSKSTEKRLQTSPPGHRPDPLNGMKGQQIYHSSKYFSSLNEHTPATAPQSQSHRLRPEQPPPVRADGRQTGAGSPRSPKKQGQLIAQGSDEEIEIMIQDEDRSPSPAQQRASGRQSALEAKRVKS